MALEDQFRIWKQLVESNASLGEKIEKTDLMMYIEQASKRVTL